MVIAARRCIAAYLTLIRHAASTAAAFDYDAHHTRAHPTGDTVARAKRTERAAARRRYRAATEPELLETEAEEELEAPAPRGARAAPAARSAPDTGRVGIGAALRSSFRPLRVREDLAALPSLVTHRSLWLPVAVTVGGAVVVAVAGIGDGSALGIVGVLLFQYFLFPPALGGVVPGRLPGTARQLAARCDRRTGRGGLLLDPHPRLLGADHDRRAGRRPDPDRRDLVVLPVADHGRRCSPRSRPGTAGSCR